MAPRLTEDLQKVWQKVSDTHGYDTFPAAVSMALRDHVDAEGLIRPGDEEGLLTFITCTLYGIGPPPEDDRHSVR